MESHLLPVVDIFKTTGRYIRRHPVEFLVFVVALFGARRVFHLMPLGLVGQTQYAVAWAFSLASQFCVLCVASALWYRIDQRNRKADPRIHPQLAGRVLRAIPYGLLFVLIEQATGYLGYGLFQALGSVWDISQSSFGLSLTTNLSALPMLFLLSRFGFTLTGAAMGRPLSLKRSWRMTSTQALPLLLTILVWWIARQVPGEFVRQSGVGIEVYYTWLSIPYQMALTVFFYAVAAQWHLKLEQNTPIEG